MTSKQKASAKKTYCVWADHVRRMDQHVEASSPKEAYEIALEQPVYWEPCELHDSNGNRLSNEVPDLKTEECIAIDGKSHCETCGCEIVATINESCFRDGECCVCEYERYKSQSSLLHACQLALDEIEQWRDIMGGSEDPRTQNAIDALTEAIRKAHGEAS